MMLAVTASFQSLLENAETVPGLEGLGLLNVDMSGTVVGWRLVMINWLFGAGASAMPGLLFASVHCASYLQLCLKFITSACVIITEEHSLMSEGLNSLSTAFVRRSTTCQSACLSHFHATQLYECMAYQASPDVCVESMCFYGKQSGSYG